MISNCYNSLPQSTAAQGAALTLLCLSKAISLPVIYSSTSPEAPSPVCLPHLPGCCWSSVYLSDWLSGLLRHRYAEVTFSRRACIKHSLQGMLFLLNDAFPLGSCLYHSAFCLGGSTHAVPLPVCVISRRFKAGCQLPFVRVDNNKHHRTNLPRLISHQWDSYKYMFI